MNKISFNSFPNLTTRNYYLRQPSPHDAEKIFLLRSNKNVNKYLDRTIAKTIDDARNFITEVSTSIFNNSAIYWVICPKDDSNLVGTICIWNIDNEKYSADIGFELLPEYQGKGIMQEVLPSVLQYGFEKMKLKVINGEVEPRNIKSIKLLERHGFKLKEAGNNFYVYTLEK